MSEQEEISREDDMQSLQDDNEDDYVGPEVMDPSNDAFHVQTVHGNDPQSLIEKIIRMRIYECAYYKEFCFALNEASLVDRAIAINHIGGAFGNQQPTPFLCLLLKMLQIQPKKEIINAYLDQKDFKYLRALTAMYVRLTFPSHEVFSTLEPLMADYRKLRRRRADGKFDIVTMDEFLDNLLTEERVCETTFPRLTMRSVLEQNELLPPREYVLEENDYSSDEDGSRADSVEDTPHENRPQRLKFKTKKTEEQTDDFATRPKQESDAFRESMSIEETNRIRASLGLKPLK